MLIAFCEHSKIELSISTFRNHMKENRSLDEEQNFDLLLAGYEFLGNELLRMLNHNIALALVQKLERSLSPHLSLPFYLYFRPFKKEQ